MGIFNQQKEYEVLQALVLISHQMEIITCQIKEPTNVAEGTSNSNAITKNQLHTATDTKLSKSGGIMTGNLDMNNKSIYNLA